MWRQQLETGALLVDFYELYTNQIDDSVEYVEIVQVQGRRFMPGVVGRVPIRRIFPCLQESLDRGE